MNLCRYTLMLDAGVHPDLVARLASLLDAWDQESPSEHAQEPMGEYLMVTTVRRSDGDGLGLTEAITDKLACWGFSTAFTLVEHGTATTMGAVHRFAPALGTNVLPWHLGSDWLDTASLRHAVDRFSADELVDHLRRTVLAEPWIEQCPPAPAHIED